MTALETAAQVDNSLPAKSAILIEQESGRVLFEKNADEVLPAASITKVMTLLLVMEALDSGRISLDDMVTCLGTRRNRWAEAQIWFKAGEQMSVDDLSKATAISSANDASVALAEMIAGSEEAFVGLMNERAQQLGMTNTHFVNATGLDAEGHVTTARDIATMSRELLGHPKITEYSSVWMSELRDGQTQLVNTNKLVRFYEGCTGLKTGTTGRRGQLPDRASATREWAVARRGGAGSPILGGAVLRRTRHCWITASPTDSRACRAAAARGAGRPWPGAPRRGPRGGLGGVRERRAAVIVKAADNRMRSNSR